MTDYTATTTNATNTITATAPEGTTISIKVNGDTHENGTAAEWEDGENEVKITVTKGGLTSVYTVIVSKTT